MKNHAFRKSNIMKTKRIISRFLLVLIVLITFYLQACKREEWCADCQWICTDTEPIFGDKEERFCVDSREQCEIEVQDFLDSRFLPSCWECSEPHQE